MIQPIQVFTVFGSCFVERQGDYLQADNHRAHRQDHRKAPIQTMPQDGKQRFTVIAGTKRLDTAQPLPLAA